MNARHYLALGTLLLALVASCEEGGPTEPGPGPGPGAPNNPESFTATAASASSIALAWSAVEGVSGYLLERRTSDGSFSQVATSPAGAT